jgi:4-aminobutyrate aminotransferase-like enzyme/GNAT superfamily N-acetyltransferase
MHSRDLEWLEDRQRDEAPAPEAPVRRETSRVRIPHAGAIPRSAAWLERLYAGELIPREKKPQVIDTRRCWGPYMVSIDEPPMVLLDACSQIATLTDGFAHPGVLRGLHEGRFDGCLWANPDTRIHESSVLRELSERLLGAAPMGLDHTAFVAAGGAEANEKALRIARLHGVPYQGRDRRRVLAFEGSFHGRTLVTLAATANAAKRIGVTQPGFEALFCPRSLEVLARMLDEHAHELYAVLIEPMMAEGGDIHLAREFVLGVRELTRVHDLPLIADEVQTGFGTSGEFFWWTRLGLADRSATAPDLLTCAKKAGLGVVLSRWPDPEPVAVNVVSALRGLIQAEGAQRQASLEAPILARLDALAREFPELVAGPRGAGSAFAFDLPSAAARERFIEQRFARGFMTYHAGETTIRFRLGSCWEPRHLDDLFERIATALGRLDDPRASEYQREGAVRRRAHRIDVDALVERDWPEIMVLELAAYEAERADDEAYLRKVSAAGLGLVARDSETHELLGFAIGGPLEMFGHVVGPDRDASRGTGNTFYSADLAVAAAARGRGVGRSLKRAQLEWAHRHGYRFVTGRNKVGATDEMGALNRALGAYTVEIFNQQYDGHSQAEYYRVPLCPPRAPELDTTLIDLASGIQSPFGPAPKFMATRELVGPTASRINLSNWATIDTIHYAEHLRAILPRSTSHLYTTSSRDEAVDKALRCLKLGRPQADVAIGLVGGYLGQTTAAARSLSDPRGFGDEFALFDWPLLPHPDAAGLAATIAALEQAIATRGAAAIIGVFVELVGERSGLVVGADAALALQKLCNAHAIPLVVVETTTGGYRRGAGPWGIDALPLAFVPDMVLWYPGGQLGQIFVGSRWWVGAPLMLISTWDGDEVSVIRTHEHLRAAHRLDLLPAIAELGTLVELAAARAGGRSGGAGLYRTLTLADEDRATRLCELTRARGLLLGHGLPDTLLFVPPLDISPAQLRGPIRAIVLDAIASLPDA